MQKSKVNLEFRNLFFVSARAKRTTKLMYTLKQGGISGAHWLHLTYVQNIWSISLFYKDFGFLYMVATKRLPISQALKKLMSY